MLNLLTASAFYCCCNSDANGLLPLAAVNCGQPSALRPHTVSTYLVGMIGLTLLAS
ncbi:hypothetical protein PI125_g19590 [Phytophthora idaei]|nr:hypothetical protein PI125_g19590 [Phytophthora idaei]